MRLRLGICEMRVAAIVAPQLLTWLEAASDLEASAFVMAYRLDAAWASEYSDPFGPSPNEDGDPWDVLRELGVPVSPEELEVIWRAARSADENDTDEWVTEDIASARACMIELAEIKQQRGMATAELSALRRGVVTIQHYPPGGIQGDSDLAGHEEVT